jgi:hypothetical protein
LTTDQKVSGLNPDGVTEITTNTTRGSKWSPFLICMGERFIPKQTNKKSGDAK